jgi:hypothetical protein
VIVPSGDAISLILLRACVDGVFGSWPRLPLLMMPAENALDLIFFKDCDVAVSVSRARLPVLVVCQSRAGG